MFHLASKMLDLFFQPLNGLLIILIAALLLRYTHWKRLRRSLTFIAILGFFLCGFTQLPDYLLAKLESTVPPLTLEELEKPTGIIILGGAITEHKQARPNWYHINDGAERIIDGLMLAKHFPSAYLLFTGGNASISGKGGNESAAFKRFIQQSNPLESAIYFENRAKNTWQNAKFSMQQLGQAASGKWLLVTSANHMPRALGSFTKAGFDVIGWPTDYRADRLHFPWLVTSSARQFSKLNLLIHELIGIAAYKISGKI